MLIILHEGTLNFSSAGGGIWTHEPLRDGIPYMDLKSRVSKMKYLFGQALQPPPINLISKMVIYIMNSASRSFDKYEIKFQQINLLRINEHTILLMNKSYKNTILGRK